MVCWRGASPRVTLEFCPTWGGAITVAAVINPVSTHRDAPRARGAVHVSTKARGPRTVLDDFRQAGSLKLLFPKRPQPDLQAVLVNTAGGVTGGDVFNLSASVAPDTQLTLTTQAAERAYAAQPDQTGRIDTKITVGDGAQLTWVPQEMILFNHARLQRRLTVDLAQTARTLITETVVFGRQAMAETVTGGVLDDRITVLRDGRPLFVDAVRLSGDMAQTLTRPFVGAGARAVTTLIYVAPDAEAHLDPLRDRLGPTGGASLLHDDVLVVRLMSADSFAARAVLVPLLTDLSGTPLPRTWML